MAQDLLAAEEAQSRRQQQQSAEVDLSEVHSIDEYVSVIDSSSRAIERVDVQVIERTSKRAIDSYKLTFPSSANPAI